MTFERINSVGEIINANQYVALKGQILQQKKMAQTPINDVIKILWGLKWCIISFE